MSSDDIEHAAAELALAVGALVRRIRATAPAEIHDLTWTQKSVIVRLDRDGPATAADLARAESVKSQSMATAIATLEEMGLVARKPHPTDGRQMLVALTPKGKTVRKQTKEAKQTWLVQAIGQLDKRDQQKLFDAGEIIKQLVEK